MKIMLNQICAFIFVGLLICMKQTLDLNLSFFQFLCWIL